jgi:hypothetical protein
MQIQLFWEFSVQWTSVDQCGRRHRKRLKVAILPMIFLIATGVDMAKAQSQSIQNIAVTCTGAEKVAAETLVMLCADLHKALAAKYPDAHFVLTDSGDANATGLVTLETFAANRVGIDARLNWQAKGADRVDGSRMGFSISDTDMTPDMQRTFLNRLVHDTPLPF